MEMIAATVHKYSVNGDDVFDAMLMEYAPL